jgi:hypothetical protein
MSRLISAIRRNQMAPECVTTGGVQCDGQVSAWAHRPVDGGLGVRGKLPKFRNTMRSLPSMNTLPTRGRTAFGRPFAVALVVAMLLASSLLAASRASAQIGPTVTAIFPSDGPASGGTSVLINGSGFSGVQSVTFGGVPATSFTVHSSTSISAITPPNVPGLAQVVVNTTFGSSTSPVFFQYTGTGGGGGPSVTGVSPNAGPTTGGTSVVITGTGFTAVTGVTFGAVAATSFVVNHAGQITATSPAQGAGTVNVRVTTSAGTSPATAANQFTYVASPPTITNVNPNAGPTSGGTSVVITGTNFTGVLGVTFGTTPATSFTVNSAAQITAVSPAHTAGTVDIRVTNGAGTSPITAADQFTFTAGGPIVTNLNPNAGPVGGGTTVVITGTGFTNVTQVRFGTVNAPFTVNSSTQITATAPAQAAAGTVFVRVTTNLGTSPDVAAAQFTYTGGPVITNLNPNAGPVGGGTTVVITGAGFTSVTDVRFGTVNAPFTVNSSTQITATAPAQAAAGTVFVRVVTLAGTSPDTTAAQFTYTGGPVITNLNPNSGPISGGTLVVITGSGFTAVSQVRFGTVNAAFTVISSTQITATAPAQAAAGTVFVRVVATAGTSPDTAAAQFTYTGGPVITNLNPNSGPISGGTVVVITGSGFTGATAVTFGGVNAAFTVNSATQITATAPARSTTGTVHVRVTTPAGTSAQVTAAEFTYTATTGTVTYTLRFRWTLIAWQGIDNIAIANALSGQGMNQVGAGQLTSVAGQVTAIYRWDSVNQRWQAHFPGTGNVPGANDFNTFQHGQAYFLAIVGPGPLTWVVQRGVPAN